MNRHGLRVAIVGAGLSGATAARRLAEAGHAVQVFDKSRGVGGRLATRRADWTGPDGQLHQAAFDHGAPGFGASTREFREQVEAWQAAGLLQRWAPLMAPGSYVPLDPPSLWVPTPDMPALCRHLLGDLPVLLRCTIEALRHGPEGWSLQASSGSVVGRGFDAVLLALPPAQAASLLAPHRPDWAQRAQAGTLAPCWTLMGETDEPDPAPSWQLAWPPNGPLGWIIRNDSKPGRWRQPGRASWVLHATAAWSATHLEAPAEAVREALQQALAARLGQAPTWRHAVVHRWRYASVPRSAATAGRCWWDPALGLGACGDALGGAGVEGAWQSGAALAEAVGVAAAAALNQTPCPASEQGLFGTTRRVRGPSAV